MDILGRRAFVKFRAVGIVLIAFLLLFLAQTAAAQGTWSPTGSMSTGRADFTLTRLCDGKVLAAGGSDASGTLSSAELYDPASGTWTPTGPMTAARASHTATLLPFPDCRVLVAGGAGPSGIFSSAELYDPVSGTWSPTGSLSVARLYHTAVLLNNGKVLIAAGGIQGVGDTFGTTSAELYDPASGTWAPTGSLNTARMGQQGVLLADGRVLVAGGMPQGVTFQNFASAELYDPVSGTWPPTGSMVSVGTEFTTAGGRRGAFTLTLLPNDKVLVAGGVTNWTAITTDKAELYDPATGTWSPTSPLPTTRHGHTATLLPSGKVLVAGGNDHPGNFGPGTIVSLAELYDPAAGTWSVTGSLNAPRMGHQATLLLDGRVLVAGGRGPSPLATAELFGPVDTAPPVLTVPDDVTIECDQSIDPSNTGTATATDNVDPGLTITFSDATTPGASPDEKTLTRTWTATDSSGNSASADQIITVVDTTAPLLTAPADIVVTANTAGGYAGSIGTATATDNCDPSPTITNDAPGVFPLGDTIVTWTATDRTGNSASATQKVTVKPIPVDIDIKPGSDPNSINCNDEDEAVTVAILTTEDFDATTVDHTTVTFEEAGETHVDKKTGDPRRHEEDVDGDGDVDLVFHFRLRDTNLTCSSTEGTLTGQTFDAVAIQGTDVVRMVEGGQS